MLSAMGHEKYLAEHFVPILRLIHCTFVMDTKLYCYGVKGV